MKQEQEEDDYGNDDGDDDDDDNDDYLPIITILVERRNICTIGPYLIIISNIK